MSLMSSENPIIKSGISYLKTFDGINCEIIRKHLIEWKININKEKDINDFFKIFLIHAKNRQRMNNAIGEIERFEEQFCNFNLNNFNKKYTDWLKLFNEIENIENPPNNMDSENSRNLWVIYCKSAISIANFLKPYKNSEEFIEFTSVFLKNEHTKLALPLLISAEIFGFGFALACDLIKDNISPGFVKPDVHIRNICQGLKITSSNNDFDIFKDLLKFCEKIDQVPYEVDRLFWLIGSGDFYLDKININSSVEGYLNFRCKNGIQ